MQVEIKVPMMGESITQATVGNIIKNTGSYVAADEELLELETDKVNQVLYAPQAGVVSWDVKADDVVIIGQVIGHVDTSKTAPPKGSEAKKETAPTPAPKESKKVEAPKPALPPMQRSEGVRGTKEGFLASLSSQSAQKPAKGERAVVSAPVAESKVLRETRKPLTKIRKVIATRLVEALQETAMLTTFNEVDMSKVMALRESYKEDFAKKYQSRLGYMSFFIKASVSALKAFPQVNSYIDGDDVVLRNYFDLSIAVGTDRGLVVPVIRNCDKLSFAELENALEGYAKKAREGGLTVDELQGGGFTITNGGVYGSLLSTPILNMPQSAILGMHKIEKRAVVVDDQIVIRPMMYLALSYDHRVIDGKEAVSFLVHIKNCLEDPARMLIEL